MPKIKIAHIVSFSSEDPTHPATNLINYNSSKHSWQCEKVGEPQVSVILQLEQASQITSIDVGNEGAAYVEILVSRCCSQESLSYSSGDGGHYSGLLAMSPLMTTAESRQNTNRNGVKLYVTKDLQRPERNQKWDRIKIVCTQPFNKHTQYGLSFINFYETVNEENTELKIAPMGRFNLRPESPPTFGGLLHRKKFLQDEKSSTLGIAAAIRQASHEAAATLGSISKCKPQLITGETPASSFDNITTVVPSTSSRNRHELLYDDKNDNDNNEKIEKIDMIMALNRPVKDSQQTNQSVVNQRTISDSTDSTTTPNTNDNKTKTIDRIKADTQINQSPKRKLTERADVKSPKLKKTPKKVSTRAFQQLLQGVQFVISGIQNPDRAKLRKLAISMGAKYKPNWNNSCTHLICAFINTPKFHQVRGKGKIVTRSWLEECHSKRMRLPWRRYALDSSDQLVSESEEEIFEEETTPNSTSRQNDSSNSRTAANEAIDVYNVSTDEEYESS